MSVNVVFRFHNVFLWVFLCLVVSSICFPANADEKPYSGVVPARGPLTKNELRSVVIETRECLREKNHTVAVQKNVRDAAAKAGVADAPTLDQIRATSMTINTLNLFVPVVTGDASTGYELVMVRYSANDPKEISSLKTVLPPRTIEFTRDQLRPAVQILVIKLLGLTPDPAVTNYPNTESANPFSVLSVFATSPPKPIAPVLSSPAPPDQPAKSLANTGSPVAGPPVVKPKAHETLPNPALDPKHKTITEPTSQKDEDLVEGPPDPVAAADAGDLGGAEKDKWEKWFHRGIFGELGFLVSWCKKDGLCKGPDQGIGIRLRVGIRIESIIALSVSGIGLNHKIPIPPDAKALMNLKEAFAFGGIFGGIRYHPIKKFIVDPFIGLDIGHLWLVYFANREVEPDPLASVYMTDSSIEQIYARRETVILKGPAFVPEFGVNIFVAPVLSFGFHFQWILPVWRETCVNVYNPSESKFSSSDQVCAKIKELDKPAAAEMDEALRDMLSKKDNRPRFFGLEFNLTLLFK